MTDKPTRIVSFCLFGANEMYHNGMLANMHLCADLLPDWTVYCFMRPQNKWTDAEHATSHVLHDNGVEIIRVDSPDWSLPAWRFMAGNKLKGPQDVAIFRDADSRINARELAAMDEWLKIGYPFHVMRDHNRHNVPVLAGMWGVAGPSLRAIIGPMLQDWVRQCQEEVTAQLMHAPSSKAELAHALREKTRCFDQHFLTNALWPIMADYTLAHTSQGFHHGEDDNRPFPEHGDMGASRFVGDIIEANGLAKEGLV